MKVSISGEIAQVAWLEWEGEESVWASKGSLMSYTRGVAWSLRIPGGLGGAVRRSMAGEGMALTFLEAQAGESVLLASNAPGHIAEWELAAGPVVATSGSFLAAWGEELDITVTMAQRAGAALFGGAGLFMQRVAGRGRVLIHGSGDFQERRLAEGETILISTGNLAAFAASVDYDIQRVGGARRALFGGEGLFVAQLTGPGRVLLQTLKRTG